MKNKATKVLYTIVMIIALVITLLSAGYAVLPQEYQDMIPVNKLTALLAGGTSGTIALTLLRVSSVLAKNTQETKDINADTLNAVIQLTKRNVDLIMETEKVNKRAEETTKRNNELMEMLLKVKQDNPLLKEELKAEIKKVLENEKEK